jgi:hypothetical protein
VVGVAGAAGAGRETRRGKEEDPQVRACLNLEAPVNLSEPQTLSLL